MFVKDRSLLLNIHKELKHQLTKNVDILLNKMGNKSIIL